MPRNPPLHLSRLTPLLSPSRKSLPLTPLFPTKTYHHHRRHTSTDSPPPHNFPLPLPLSPRWLSDLKKRIGKCIIFGLSNQQIDEAGEIMKIVARDWRDLVAGSEGFLTGRGRAGFEGREVVWGEMDVMPGQDVAPLRIDAGHAILPRNASPIATFSTVCASAAKLDLGHTGNLVNGCSLKGHVNNVTYIRYAESARINWAQNFANHIDPKHRKEWSELWTPNGDGLILRSIKTDFKFPMAWPDRISVYHKLRAAPTTSTDSFILDVLILSERYQRPAARCEEDIVVYDYRQARKSPLRGFMVDKFRETFALQEQAKRQNEAAVRKLLQRLRWLEKSSWDRADAVEDMGSVPGTH